MQRLLTWVAIAVAVLLFASSTWVSCELDRRADQIVSLTDTYNQSQASLKIWRNKDSTSQASLRAAMIDKEIIDLAHNKELDGVRKKVKGLERSLKNLQSLTTVGSTTSGTVITKIDTVTVDSISTPSFAYKDEWVTLSGYFLRSDSVSIDYSVRDSILIAQQWERAPGFFGLFKPKILRTDVISENPNSTIKTLKSIAIREKPRRFSLVAVGGYGLYQGGMGPFIGFGLGYSLIKF